jgi:hypothetical protein
MGAQAVDSLSSARNPSHERLNSTRLTLLLAQVATLAGSNLPRFRALRTSGFLLAGSGVASVLLVRYLGAGDVADIVALRIVAYACWLYGAFGLWALLSPEALEASGEALLRMRGQSQLLFRSQTLGIARHLTLGMLFAGMPGMVAAAAISSSVPTLLLRGGLIALSIIYLASLGLVLGAVGALCYKAAPRSPRRAALGVVLLPFLISFTADSVPSIPGFYSWALSEMIAWGGNLS